jgi:hypothetical protein
METREILEGMLDFFREREWIQGCLYSYGGPPEEFYGVQGACLEGACNLVMSQREYVDHDSHVISKAEIDRVIIRTAAELFPGKKSGHPIFMHQVNDHPAMTREDIFLILKHAIERESQ